MKDMDLRVDNLKAACNATTLRPGVSRGFGKRTLKTLSEAIEHEQAFRGIL